jgi:hypothetical protein
VYIAVPVAMAVAVTVRPRCQAHGTEKYGIDYFSKVLLDASDLFVPSLAVRTAGR